MDIAVTGYGVVSPVGVGAKAFWQAMLNGESGIAPLTRLDVDGFKHRLGGEVDTSEWPDCGLDPATEFALKAATEAIQMAGAAGGDNETTRTATVLATNFGGVCRGESLLAYAGGHGETTPDDAQQYFFQDAADTVAGRLGLGGLRQVLSLSCASGTAAIVHGANLIQNGRADRALVGGYDSISRFAWSGLSALRTMTKEDCIRPFDLNRGGTLFSEGAGALFLEPVESARERGTEILAIVAGGALGNNAHHMTAPAPRGAGTANVMRRALEDARLGGDAIDHINTHGTGTKYNDLTETQAIRDVFGDHAGGIPITSIKSMTGHLMGAAGAIEAIASVLSLEHGVIPPTINFETPDPECDLDLVANTPREAALRSVLSNSAGIGGCNAVVILTRPEAQDGDER